MPTVNAGKHSAHDLQLAGQMRREDYKAIKHMDKVALASYLKPGMETRLRCRYQGGRGPDEGCTFRCRERGGLSHGKRPAAC